MSMLYGSPSKVLTQKEVSKFLAGWKKRQQHGFRPKINEPLRREVLKKANLAAEVVRNEYPELQLFLFGSLIWNNVFTDHSDIDIAIKGLKGSRDLLHVFGKIYDSVIPFDVDVVLLEEVSDSLRERIIQDGLRL